MAKGNGYGFGLAMLGAETERLGCDTLAVGTLDEAPLVHDAFRGDVLVLTPWHPAIDPEPADDDRLILTASSPEAVRALSGHGRRVVVELLTSMRRFGLDEEALAAAVPDIRRLALEGFALHLPIDDGELPRVEEISSWVSTLATSPAAHRHPLGQPRVGRRAGDAAPPTPRDPFPATDRHRPLARRPRLLPGARHRARRAPHPPRTALRLPPAQALLATDTC